MAVAPGPTSALVEAAPLPSAGDPDQLARFVLVDPTGQHQAIRTITQLQILGGPRLQDGVLRGIGLLAEWGAILGDADRRWDGLTFDGFENYQERTPRFDTRFTSNGNQLAVRIAGAQWSSVVQEHGSLQRDPSLRITSKSDRGQWFDVVNGRGVAAIGDSIIVVLGDGALRIYDPDGGDKPRLVTNVGEPADALSAFGEACVALSTHDAATRVRWIDGAGRVAWQVEIPFVAMQPAIDGGNGRVYIAGLGLAAIENGRVLWSSATTSPIRATAFGDGTLVGCAGTELQFIAANGAIVRQLVTPIAATLLTPPAIGPRGEVWVASSDQLWVTR